MSFSGQTSVEGQRGPSSNRFLFVSSDGVHPTHKKDVRAHLSRYTRRQAWSRVAPNPWGVLTFEYRRSVGPAPGLLEDAAKKAEGENDAPCSVVPVRLGSSPDLGFDSVSSNSVQESAVPVGQSQDCLSSTVVADEDDVMGIGPGDVDCLPDRTEIISSSSQEQRRHTPPIPVAAHAGDRQTMGRLKQHALFQTSSAWSPVDSMPLDPFDSLPLRLSHSDQSVLLSFQVIPDAVYQISGSRSINNCRDWAFPLIVKTPMLMYSAMAVVSAGREMRLGIEPSPATLAYKSCHIRTLNWWIRHPSKRHSAEVLMGISALIALENYRGWSPSLALHVQAFSQILRARGGWSSFQDDPRYGWFLFGPAIMWSQVAVRSLLGAGDTLPAFRDSIAADMQDLLAARDNFLQLLSSWIIWARRRVNEAISDPQTRGQYDRFLGEEALLFKLLHAPDYLRSTIARTVEAEWSHRNFAIIFLVLVKWEQRDRPYAFLDFLGRLSRQMRLHDLRKTSTSIPLVWLFIRGIDDCPQRKIQALALLRVLHVIQPTQKERLLQFLLRLLLFEPSSCLSPFSFEDLEALDRAVSQAFPLEDSIALGGKGESRSTNKEARNGNLEVKRREKV